MQAGNLAATKWWSKDTVAVVTGANKGIGLEIVKGLAKNGITTVLTARDSGRGTKAVEQLKSQGFDSVVFHPLEVSKAESVETFATWLKNEYGGLDILINNAGAFPTETGFDIAKITFDTNYYGVKLVTSHLLPLMRPDARIVNVSSIVGQFVNLGSSLLVAELNDEEKLTEDYVDSFATKYLDDVKAGRWKEEGWARTFPHYSESKVLLNAYTRALGKTLSRRPEGQKIYVNAIHPGYIQTDMNSNTGPQSAEEGADTPVWLALLPKEGYFQGQFFFKRKFLSW